MKLFKKNAAPTPAAAETEPKVKSALLQTYITSLLSLVLCAAMFLGTSYAWFTSEVTNETNEIYIGILDVGLYRQTDTQRLDLSDNANKLYDRNIRWEPGYTSLETVHVVNEGDLAFKYVLNFTDGKLDDQTDPNLQEVAKWFDVWVYNDAENTIPTTKQFSQISAPGSGWVKAGTLDQLLAGEAVFDGMMEANTVRKDAQQPTTATDPSVNPGTTDGMPAEKTYTIALHMQPDADLSVMGRKITLNVKLVAYQMSSEQDSFGNAEYDDVTYVATKEALAAALQNAQDGAVIGIAPGTYDFTAEPMVVSKAITLQGMDPANKPVLEFMTSNTGTITHGVEIQSNGVTLKNLKLAADPAGTASGNLVQISPKGNDYYSDITIVGCEFTGSNHCIAMYGNNVTIENCILDESNAASQGNIIYVWGTSGKLTIKNNHFIGKAQKKHGISLYHQSAQSRIAGQILIEGNTFEDVYKGIVHEGSMTYTDVSVQILNNTFENSKYEFVAVDNGSFLTYEVSGNIFCAAGKDGNGKQRAILSNDAGAAILANGNYWAAENPVWDEVIDGDNVTVETYYKDPAKTNLASK